MSFSETSVQSGDESFTVRELSARQRKDLFKMHKDEIDPIEIQAHIIKMGCPAFKDKDLDSIFDLPGSLYDSLANAVLKISGLSDDAEAQAEKNSETQDENSSLS